MRYTDTQTIEAAAREQWAHDAKLREEFDGDEEAWIAWRRADAMGVAKIFGERTK